jgi:hypothetical protein
MAHRLLPTKQYEAAWKTAQLPLTARARIGIVRPYSGQQSGQEEKLGGRWHWTKGSLTNAGERR